MGGLRFGTLSGFYGFSCPERFYSGLAGFYKDFKGSNTSGKICYCNKKREPTKAFNFRKTDSGSRKV
jgi:hypothetical protein